MTKQGISDLEHAALIARAAHAFHKRTLGLIDNTEMGALATMTDNTLTELRAIAANFESRARALASHQRSSHTADAAAKRSMLIQHNVWGAAYQYMIDRITALEHTAIEADHTARNLKRAASFQHLFKECDSCAAKPGSPTLCGGCLHNRATIEWLQARG